MKKAGKTRFLGITGHNRPMKFIRMLETGDVDVMMVAMNFADRYTYGFEDKVLPVARKHGTGVLAMKVYGGIRGGFAYVRQRRPSQMDEAYLQNAVRYAMEIEGVSGLVMGVHDSEELRQNIAFVKGYTPLSARERGALERHGKRLAEEWGPRWGSVEA
jgi:predicted aldo/keto reductase-like oxidoreductase